MVISEQLLEMWASAPDDKPAQEAYRQIQEAVSKSPELQSKTIEVYLQGSYRNRTHIKENSDVDVVVELQSTFSPDTKALPPEDKRLFDSTHSDATYHFSDLRRDVELSLIRYFGEKNVDFGNKAITVTGNQGRSTADVIPCLEHRKYTSYRYDKKSYIPGIKFYTRRENIEIINWPKVHYKNGAAKNDRTKTMYKALVRICKNYRDFLVAEGHLVVGTSPSYFLECLVYNVPDNQFDSTYTVSLKGMTSFLKQANLNGFCCVNEQDYLFEPSKGWDINKARDFINWMEMLTR